MRRIVAIVLAVALLALIGFRIVQKKQTLGAGGQAGGGRGGRGGGTGAPVAVEEAVAGPRAMETSVEAVGTAASPQTVRLSPPAAGRITFLQAREGDRVTAGETLVRIDPAQLEGAVLENVGNVSEAQARLAQAQATIGASDVQVESAIRTGRAGVASAKAKLDQAAKTEQAQIAAAEATARQQEGAGASAPADVVSAEAQVSANEANLRTAEVKYQRTNNLFQGGFIAAQDVDDARAAQETARGNLGASQQLAAANRAKVAQAQAQLKAAQANVVVARRQAESGVLTAQADLRSAQATLATAIANLAQMPANRKNLQALQASVNAAQGQLTAAQAQIANTELKSPIDGTITQRAADPGTLAQPGTPVLTIQVLRQIYVESSFPVELANQIQPGMEASVTFDNIPDGKFVGKVFDVNRAADPSSRQFTLRVLLDNPGLKIRPGMFGQVRIVTSRTNPAVVVPLNAVTQTQDGKSTVAVDANGAVQMREVTLGQRDEQGVQILSGIAAGDKVVTERARAVKDGQKIVVGDPNAPAGGQGGGGRGGGGRRGRRGGGGGGQ